MRSLGATGVWELFVPDVGPGLRYKFEILGADGVWRAKADPLAKATEQPPATASVVTASDARVARRRVDRRTRDDRPALRAAERVRGAPGLLAPRPRLPRARGAADRLRHRAGVHARRAAARRGAPVRRVVGLPGHQLLRADRAVRLARRLPPPRGPAPPGRDRHHPRLGARALPARRVRPRPLRRRAPVRAPGPPARRAAGLGHADLRLRPPRGAQLPRGERDLLVRGVPRRRAARGRRRLHALPRLLPQGGRVGAQRARRAGEPGGHRVPAGDQRDRLPAHARRHDDRRGVDGVPPGHRPRRRAAAWASA